MDSENGYPLSEGVIMPNVDLTKQILVKVSEDLDTAIEQACIDHRKQTGENISKPEKVREIVYHTLISQNIKERLLKEAIQVRLGKLPATVIEACQAESKKGKLSHTIVIETSRLLFQLAYCYYDVERLRSFSVFGSNGNITPDYHQYDAFIEQIVSELQIATGLKVKGTNLKYEVSLEISWSDKDE